VISHFHGNPGYWQSACEQVKVEGLWLEFGVFEGQTVNMISRYTEGRVFGFDSFEGLPEKWERGDKGWYSEKGAFSTEGKMPAVNDNVRLIKGLFSETLPRFLKEHDSDVAFLHIDCDLYSSTKTVFDLLHPRIKSGTIIAFDEIYNYPGFEKHELKALLEFAEQRGVVYEWLYHTEGKGGAASQAILRTLE